MNGTKEFKVGLFVALGLALIAYMSLHVNNDPSKLGRSTTYFVVLDNASGLVRNSNIKMAGIPVGIIDTITLENGKARVEMSLQGGLHVTRSASVEMLANGILGDKYLELQPGNPEDERIPEGGEITKVVDKGSFDAVLNQVGKIAKDMSEVSEAFKKATTGAGDEDSPIGRIILNVEDVTADLKTLISEKKGSLGNIVDRFDSISVSIDEFINDDSADGFKHNWKKMSKSLGKVDKILDNVEDITGKVNDGKGTLGKLVNDETTVDEINQAVKSVNKLVGAANKMELRLDYHSEFHFDSSVKNYLGIGIHPGPDRFYLFQIIGDPKGRIEIVDQSQSVGGGAATDTATQTIFRNEFKFSAQYAKKFHNLTLRAGVFENAGGVAIDYDFFQKKLRLSAEAFDFSREEGVDVRLFARYNFYGIFYAVGGGDDILNKGDNTFTQTRSNWFFGAGVNFTDDDLKLILSQVQL